MNLIFDLYFSGENGDQLGIFINNRMFKMMYQLFYKILEEKSC